MIDFKNNSVFKLKMVKDIPDIISKILIPNEQVLGSYRGIRDSVVFTDKRVIALNVQGITGVKKDVTTLPYSKVQAFSIETAGVLDMDSELDLWFSGMGCLRFEFTGMSNIVEIGKVISKHCL